MIDKSDKLRKCIQSF